MRATGTVFAFALLSSGCSLIQAPEICSVIVSKEEGYKQVCQRGDFFRVQTLAGHAPPSRASHIHYATALVPGKLISTTAQD